MCHANAVGPTSIEGSFFLVEMATRLTSGRSWHPSDIVTAFEYTQTSGRRQTKVRSYVMPGVRILGLGLKLVRL